VANGEKPSAGAITLEELIALNDEMAALVRTGIPLERGMRALGGELPGPSGRLAELIADRMGAGESLSQILSDERSFPPVWRAVVEAGIRSGRLAAALESLSTTARRVADLRRLVGAGILYPVVVVSVAYALFVGLLVWLVPITLEAHQSLTERSDAVLAGMVSIGQTAGWWGVPVPLAAALLLGAWWRRSGRVLWSGRGQAKPRRFSRGLGRGTGIRQALQSGRTATFAEVLALLLKEHVPMHESVVLAAEASGDRAFATAARQIAGRLERGEVLSRREDLPQGFPPLLGWLLMTGSRQPELSEALLRSAAMYRQRAARAATWTAVYLPITLTVLVGGTATLVCALTAFLPIVRLLYHLTWPPF